MFFDSQRERRVLAYGRSVDMRKSFNGLIALTRDTLRENPVSGDIYVFVNRSETMMKCLIWDRTGFVLVAKRLERGKFMIPGSVVKRLLKESVLRLIFDGITLGGMR